VNSDVFTSTIEEFMDPTSQLIKTCFRLTTPSAFKYDGKLTKEQLFAAYDDAVKWARDSMKNNKALNVCIDSHPLDSADQYLLLTYLILDKLNADQGLNSVDFRAAASHFDLSNSENFKKINAELVNEAEQVEKKAAGEFASL